MRLINKTVAVMAELIFLFFILPWQNTVRVLRTLPCTPPFYLSIPSKAFITKNTQEYYMLFFIFLQVLSVTFSHCSVCFHRNKA